MKNLRFSNESLISTLTMLFSQTRFRYLKSKPAVVMVTQVIAAFYKAFGQTFIKEMINRIFYRTFTGSTLHWGVQTGLYYSKCCTGSEHATNLISNETLNFSLYRTYRLNFDILFKKTFVYVYMLCIAGRPNGWTDWA